MNYSLALVVPAEHKSVADAVTVGLGFALPGDATYTVRLSAGGQEPPTYYGCHTIGDETFVAMLELCKVGGPLPGVDWAAVGTTEQAVHAMCSALFMRQADLAEYATNFAKLLAEHGLSIVQSVD